MNDKNFNPNEVIEGIKKASELLGGDYLGKIKEMSGLAENILNSQNPSVREFDIQIGKHTIKGNVLKNNNVTLSSTSAGVVEEIIKRLQHDRHI